MPPDQLRKAQFAELRKAWLTLENNSKPLSSNGHFPMNDSIIPSSITATPVSKITSSAATAAASVTPSTTATASSSAGNSPAAALGVSRRTHPKSRTGCRTCKIRKIKCDETRPSCRNCIKHGVTCPYTVPPSSATTPVSSISATASPVPMPSLLPPGLGMHGDHELNLIDLELLHNFTTATFATLSSDHLVRDVWRITAVRLGVQCDYVMRSILAVSALHIAHHRPDKRDFYFSRALAYHQLASRTATPLLGNLATSRDGWEYLYLFSTLTVFFSLGSTKQPDIIHSDAFPPWIYLLSGSKSLIRLTWLRIEEYEGPLSPLFKHGKRRWDRFHQLGSSIPIPKELLELKERIIRSGIDPMAQSIYVRAIHDLARNMFVFNAMDMNCLPDITDAFVWVFSDMDPFLVQLRAQTQESIAIMAHFGTMIRMLENQWWLEGWSFLLLAKAWDVLDDEHKLWVQWPIEQVGWIPP